MGNEAMEDEAGAEPTGSDPATVPAHEAAELQPAEDADFGADNRYLRRLRRLMGRTSAYPGPISAITHCWVSRDSAMHIFSARYLDFAVLTPEHLVLCSTGFFTRRPLRRVFREPLNRLVVVERGPEPVRALRILGDFSHPLLFEMRNTPNGIDFARQLVERTRPDPRRPEPPGSEPSS
jgi:hypothetical protein